jgi:hypothetical protein
MVRLSGLSGSQLATACEASTNPMSFDGCGGYLTATAEQLLITGWICERANSTYSQYVAITRKFIHDHPEKWDQPPAFLVREALMSAFPCRADTTKK